MVSAPVAPLLPSDEASAGGAFLSTLLDHVKSFRLPPELIRVAEESESCVPTIASTEESSMAFAKKEPPTGPDGLKLDDIAVMREPLYVKLRRVRGVGPEEVVAIPMDGMNWTKSQVRNVEAWTAQNLGGGDYTLRVSDEMGQTTTQSFHIDGPEKPKTDNTAIKAATQMAGFTVTGPVGAAERLGPVGQAKDSSNVVPIGGGMGVATLPNGMTMVVSTEDHREPGTPRNVAQQLFGQGADVGSSYMDMMRRLERAEADKARLTDEMRHKSELSVVLERMGRLEDKNQHGSGETEAIAELKRQLEAERQESRRKDEIAELRRSHDEQMRKLEELVKASTEKKEDPLLRVWFESQRESSAASREAARENAQAQREAARDQKDTMQLMLTSMKQDQSAIMPAFMNILTSVSQVTSGMTSTVLEAMREIADIKKSEDLPWYGKALMPVLERLPDVGQAIASGYMMGQQAKAEAMNQQAQQRKPRAIEAKVEPKPAEIAAPAPSPDSGNGKTELVIPENLGQALKGYETDVSGEADSYDNDIWKMEAAAARAIRSKVLAGQAKPVDAAKALLEVVVKHADAEDTESIPALKHLQDDEVELAVLVGLWLGACPKNIPLAAFQGFKFYTLGIFVEGLREVRAAVEKTVDESKEEESSEDQ